MVEWLLAKPLSISASCFKMLQVIGYSPLHVVVGKVVQSKEGVIVEV